MSLSSSADISNSRINTRLLMIHALMSSHSAGRPTQDGHIMDQAALLAVPHSN